MKRAALYCRVSSLKQVREGDSLDAQISALRKYVAEHNYLVNAGEYIDDGISGTKFDERDDLQRLLRDVEDGKIDIILVCRIDRWFRSVRHYTATQAILDKHNVGWTAIWEPIYDTTTPQGRLIVNQMMSIAQFEAENTGQRIRQVQQYKLSQKEVISGTTTAGYRIENKHLVPDENAEYVKAAFEMYSACGNMNAVMREYGKKYGMPGTKAAFRRMLMSPIYKGEHYTGVKDFCPAIVSSDLWEDVQRKLKMNIKKNQKEIYIFSGLIRCAECGRVMGGNTRRRQRRNCYTVTHDYRCTGYYARMPKQCNNQKVATERVIERELITRIKPMIQDRVLQYEIEEREQGRNRTAEQITETNRKLDRLKTLYIDGLIDLDTYKADRADLIKRLEDLQRKAAESHTEDVESLKRLLKPDIWEMYGDFTPEEKRRFWRGILEKITFSRKREFTIYFL